MLEGANYSGFVEGRGGVECETEEKKERRARVHYDEPKKTLRSSSWYGKKKEGGKKGAFTLP